ncbi:hypothetical protein JOB18_001382 [Solea senegalensis]|uniref:Uncharacterized protein n=1 Tax=Solea senegalensis TaxID=28829 RepID=A0AAV6T2S0_SOLSE|nr:hypothetical protein JOB18_001382 [Solea senegalensis]
MSGPVFNSWTLFRPVNPPKSSSWLLVCLLHNIYTITEKLTGTDLWRMSYNEELSNPVCCRHLVTRCKFGRQQRQQNVKIPPGVTRQITDDRNTFLGSQVRFPAGRKADFAASSFSST